MTGKPMQGHRSARGVVRGAMVASVAVLVASFASGTATASAASPWWHLTSSVWPSEIVPGGEAVVVVNATNVGDAIAAGTVTLTAILPEGSTIVENESVPALELFAFSAQFGKLNLKQFCSVSGREVSCAVPEFPPFLPGVRPFEEIELRTTIKTAEAGDYEATVSGAGAPRATLERPLPVGRGAAVFGAEHYELRPEEEGGFVDAHAGSHPFQLTSSFAFNQTSNQLEPPALARDLTFQLPAGLLGNATSVPQCSDLDFKKITNIESFCPPDTAIGVALVTFDEPKQHGVKTWPFPIFNLVPEEGEPARFGFTVVKSPVILDTSVRSGSDYGATVSVRNASESVGLIASSVTLWGVPGSRLHDEARGWECLAGHVYESRGEPCTASADTAPKPFLTMPSSCSLPFTTTVQGDSWPLREEGSEEPVARSFAPFSYSLQDELGRPLGLVGCNELPFSPAIKVAPENSQASQPTGLHVDVHVPQEPSENPEGLASAAIKDISVTFPEGVTVNPASAGGLEACSESEVGFTGVEPGTGTDLFTPSVAEPFCPDASKVGNVKITTPLIAHPLKGYVYLAAQGANPFGSLIAAYIVAEDPVSGVRVKLAGEVSLDPGTGRVTTIFSNSPQAPLEDAEIELFDGARAAFSTPTHCGQYTTTATFTPWSGTEPAHSQSSFDVTSGPHGTPCPGTLPFAPSLVAGSINSNGGAFTPLTTTLSREDGEQALQTVSLHYPPGLSGILTGVALCPEAQANAGTCPPQSLIGHSSASVGVGNEPFTVTGGQVFLTESYEGAPFGVSIVTPAVAGPFNLGNVIVRGKIDVDPHTAALTVTTDPIPHILKGVPLQIRRVNVTVDRPNFTFNPTSCDARTITGSAGSVEGASAALSTPFQAVNCALLKFTPKFQVSTSGKTSRLNGASLTVKLSYPKGSLGKQANIAKVKVQLPKQLPSRLPTLQKACVAAVFEANPRSCPPASVVGHAKVTTPVLPVPLTGSAYLVSHGGEAFPDLVMVLQGYGVTVDLVGNTRIKNGITTSTFNAAPDVPFESFELNLPEGEHSVLGAISNLCKAELKMPTEFVAQNGLEIHRTTNIAVSGCRRAKAHRNSHRSRHKNARRRK